MAQYQSGQKVTHSLVGTELVAVDTGGAVAVATTTQDIANLAGADVTQSNTAITTVGNGTLTAAGIAGGVITRTGPTGAYTDTTATAAQIVAAIPNAFVGQSFYARIKNGVGFTQTLSGGTGVTISGSTFLPALTTGTYLVTLTSLTAVTIYHISSVPILGSTPVYNTAQFDKTTDTTLAAVTGLALPLAAAGTYVVSVVLPVTSGASGGVKVALNTADTLTLTSSNITSKIFNTAVSPVVLNTASGLNTGQGATQIAVQVLIDAVLVVNAAGTLNVMFAQNASNGTTSSVLIGGVLSAIRIA